jgi:CubicO group peptidase (beta-lactamase class C family)
MLYRAFVCLFCLLVGLLPHRGNVVAQMSPDLSELERIAAEEMRETHTPGAAMVVISGDRPVVVKGFGVANIETGAPVTADTLFRIDVLSKFVGAIILVSLAEEGKLDLKAPIGKYVSGLTPKLARVSAHDLLTQTAGIKEDHVEWAETASADSIARSWTANNFFADPGTIYSYSNPGYIPVRVLIEAVAHKTFPELVSERLFSPLGMANSTANPWIAVTRPFTQSHRSSGQDEPKLIRPFSAMSVGWPGSLMFSNATDVARFLIAFLNGGKSEGREILSAGAMSKLSTPYVAYPPAAGEQEGYGIHFSKYGNHQILGTNTSWAGITGYMRMAPDSKFALLILANGGRALRKTSEKAMQMFLTRDADTAAAPNNPVQLTEAEASSYAGTYVNERTIKLVMRDGKLYLHEDATPVLGSVTGVYSTDLPVAKIGDPYFTITPVGSSIPITFALVKGAGGKVEYMHIGGRALKRR